MLLTDRRLLMFAACAVLFQMADATMLPIAAVELTAQEGTHANLIIAACILAPQAVVALLSPWLGLTAEQRG